MDQPSGFIAQNDYDFIFNRVPRACVDMVIITSQGLLLTRRNIEPYKNLWHLPGGGVRFKETFEETAARIALKEFGVAIRITDIIGACQIINDDLGPDKRRHSISTVVAADIIGGTPCRTDETSEIGYFTELPDQSEMHPYHGPYLRDKKILR